jgi:hypothetical protein
MENRPSASVVVLFVLPVAVLRTVTAAFGTISPLGSLTAPCSVAVARKVIADALVPAAPVCATAWNEPASAARQKQPIAVSGARRFGRLVRDNLVPGMSGCYLKFAFFGSAAFAVVARRALQQLGIALAQLDLLNMADDSSE